ncbi:Tetratricopeptide repeat protein 36 [Rhizophlyctis rosea]|uniref:Tetratricopeptide repeat protein 36 n=1 Tax=Rhizophlyctis rosea TaxID=64517 RepID=A0AAD5S7E9_9FUNG|nr:Tetratricopeptide repeat protein 36 [Rhizophlyctis rosea]
MMRWVNAVLDVIFDPDSTPLHDLLQQPDFGTSPLGPAPQVSTSKIPHDLLVRLKTLERDAITLAESNNLPAALTKLTEAIGLEPSYASAYNNRAQVHRLQNNTSSALSDLTKAIELSTTSNDTNILKQAYTQRAILKQQMNDPSGAEADFARGAKCGNEVAKNAVRNNPYAKL